MGPPTHGIGNIAIPTTYMVEYSTTNAVVRDAAAATVGRWTHGYDPDTATRLWGHPAQIHLRPTGCDGIRAHGRSVLRLYMSRSLGHHVQQRVLYNQGRRDLRHPVRVCPYPTVCCVEFGALRAAARPYNGYGCCCGLGASAAKRCQRVIPVLTATLRECLVPYWGISRHMSAASTTAWATPSTS